MSQSELTGGCQCGAVRFRAGRLGRPSICHCRMCQKAFGSFFGPLVTGHDVVWTRGAPKYFRSSNKAERGFCGDCGTPLTYKVDGQTTIELAIGALDRPELAAPRIQVNPADKLAFFDGLHDLPMHARAPESEEFYAGVVSYQHPDHDTRSWGESA